MPTPSILLIPDRYKSAVLYSQIPDSGAVDFDVTRATTAYRTNASGILESVASGVPRLDYPALGGCPSLLVEPAATNLALRSEEFDDASWNKTTVTVSGNTSVAPNNTATAETIEATASFGFVSQTPTLASGSTITFSVFVKNVNTSSVNLQVRSTITAGLAAFNFTGGILVSSTLTAGISRSFEDYGNGWYRISLTCVTSEINQQCRIQLPASSNTILAWGAQLETGSVATSYIPTVAATATRNADVISKTGVSGFIGQTEGTIYAEFNVSAIGAEGYVIRVGTTSFNNTIYIFRSATNTVGVAVRSNGASTFSPAAFNAGLGNVKIAIAYANGDFAFYVNGVQRGTSTAALSFTESLAAIRIGSVNDSTAFLNDRIRAAALYPTRLTNSQLASMTSL